MDRIILWPTWSPQPPSFVELKRPGKEERALQAEMRRQMVARGCDVRPMVDTIEKADALVHSMVRQAVDKRPDRTLIVPRHVSEEYFK